MENKAVLLKLLRVALDRDNDYELPACPDWDALRELAFGQGVGGVSFDGLEKIFKINPLTRLNSDKDQHSLILMKWFGYVTYAEKQYFKNLETTLELGEFFLKHHIPIMLLKGYGLSLNYPNPSKRPSGDIDIYCLGRWQEADKLVSTILGIEIDNSHHHHTVFTYKNQCVENHYDFVNVHSHRSGKKIEKHFKELANKTRGEEVLCNVFLPSPLLEAEYTVRHAACHFASGEMKMRQVLDCLLLLDKKTTQIDWDSFWKDVNWMGMQSFVGIVIEIGCKYLGFSRSSFHIPSNITIQEHLVERVLNDTILPPKFNRKAPKGYVSYIIWMLKRWWINRWRHEIVYSDTLFETFYDQLVSHLMKPSTLYKNLKSATNSHAD